MKFLAPLFFWSFLSFLPLIAIYFLKVRPRRREATAYFLWNRVFTEKKSTSLFQRLRDLLSLLLLSLVFGAVCLSLTRPEIVNDERKDLLLLIDHSASMSAGEGSQQRLALAREAAANLIRGMDASQRASVASVASDVRFFSHLTDNPRELLDAVKAVPATALGFRPEAIASLRSGDSSEWMKGHRMILITDGCFPDGKPPDGVEILKVGEPLENAGIIAADARYLPGPGNRLGIYLQIASSFRETIKADLLLKPADAPTIGKLVNLEIKPGTNPGESFVIEEAQPGRWLAKLEIRDAFPADHEVFLAAQKPKPVRVHVEAADKFFFDAAVESFSGGGSGFLLLSPESPQMVISRGKAPEAPLSLVFQPEGESPWWQSVGEPLESAVPRVSIPDHPVLRNLDSAGLNFAGARKIVPPRDALILIENEDAVPLLYTASTGGRSVIVANMNPVDADFFYSAWFPVLVHSAATYLAGRDDSLAATYTPGESMPLPGVRSGDLTTIRLPDGSSVTSDARRFGPLESPGFYTLQNQAGEWLAAVNLLSPSESLLDNSPASSSLGPIASGLPPYLILTILAILVLIIESLLYHRRKVG